MRILRENDFGGGANSRTVIGQTTDGKIIMLVIDGRQADSKGATYEEILTVLQSYDVVNACAMEGGTSAQMVYAGELQNKPYSGTPRTGATAWLIK